MGTRKSDTFGVYIPMIVYDHDGKRVRTKSGRELKQECGVASWMNDRLACVVVQAALGVWTGR